MNRNHFQLLLAFAFIILLSCFATSDLLAQCPMCKMSAESNLASGGSGGKGLNAGILFMFCLPYLFVGTLGFVWWRYNRGISTEDA